jgi:D-arginine dehydrogenase
MSYDVLVIGGGIAGATVAMELSAHTRVLLLEAESVAGYHTTGRSAATFIENYGPPQVRALTRASRTFFESAPPEFFEEPLLSDLGVLYLARANELGQLDEDIRGGDGLIRLDAAGLTALVPALAGGPIVAGAHEPHARNIDVNAFHQGALKCLKARGGQVRLNERVLGAKFEDDQWQVSTHSGRFSANKVVNASGAWGDEVAQLFGATPIGLTPMRRSIGVVEVVGEHPVNPKGPMMAGVSGDWYAKPEGHWLAVSPADATPSEPCDAWPRDGDIATGVDHMCRALGYEVRKLHASWAGLRTFAPDRCLVAGYDSSVRDFFWLVGQGGYGIQTAPAMSLGAANLVLEGKLPDKLVSEGLDVECLDPGRFHSQ